MRKLLRARVEMCCNVIEMTMLRNTSNGSVVSLSSVIDLCENSAHLAAERRLRVIPIDKSTVAGRAQSARADYAESNPVHTKSGRLA